jgi:hypothetical protein
MPHVAVKRHQVARAGAASHAQVGERHKVGGHAAFAGRKLGYQRRKT